jgi:hypothetical protein
MALDLDSGMSNPVLVFGKNSLWRHTKFRLWISLPHSLAHNVCLANKKSLWRHVKLPLGIGFRLRNEQFRTGVWQKITTTSHEIPAFNIATAFTGPKCIFGQQKNHYDVMLNYRMALDLDSGMSNPVPVFGKNSLRRHTKFRLWLPVRHSKARNVYLANKKSLWRQVKLPLGVGFSIRNKQSRTGFWHAKNHYDVTRNSDFEYRYGIHQLEMYIWPTKNHYDVM